MSNRNKWVEAGRRIIKLFVESPVIIDGDGPEIAVSIANYAFVPGFVTLILEFITTLNWLPQKESLGKVLETAIGEQAAPQSLQIFTFFAMTICGLGLSLSSFKKEGCRIRGVIHCLGRLVSWIGAVNAQTAFLFCSSYLGVEIASWATGRISGGTCIGTILAMFLYIFTLIVVTKAAHFKPSFILFTPQNASATRLDFFRKHHQGLNFIVGLSITAMMIAPFFFYNVFFQYVIPAIIVGVGLFVLRYGIPAIFKK